MKVSDYIAKFLVSKGVHHVFTVPGGMAMHLNDSFAHTEGLTAVNNLHEQASVVCAEAYSRLNGMGVACVTAGPGATNAITGVAGAWMDSIPLIVISGQVKRSDLVGNRGVRQMGVQEIGIVPIVRTITKMATQLTEPENVQRVLEEAWWAATSGRGGPVWIAVPLDVQAAEIDETKFPRPLPLVTQAERAGPTWLQKEIDQVLRLLYDAHRPVILAGHGIRLAGAKEAFENLVDRLGVPVLTTWAAQDLLYHDHPLNMGKPGPLAPRYANFVLQNADLVLALGARLDLATLGFSPQWFARGARRIAVDIDPAELAKNDLHMRIVAPLNHFLGRMYTDSLLRERAYHPNWVNQCNMWKHQYPFIQCKHTKRGQISTYNFSDRLSDALPPGQIVVSGSAGLGIEIFLAAFKAKRYQRIWTTTALGPMGFGLPSAIGAAVASGKQIVCVNGDGGFQFNIQELATVAYHKLPITFFILNNNGYASIRATQQRYFGRLSGADMTSGLALPDLSAQCEAYGIAHEDLYTQGDLRRLPSLLRLGKNQPLICEVHVRQDEVREPCLASYKKADGSMASRPLEDLAPLLSREELAQNMFIPLVKETELPT